MSSSVQMAFDLQRPQTILPTRLPLSNIPAPAGCRNQSHPTLFGFPKQPGLPVLQEPVEDVVLHSLRLNRTGRTTRHLGANKPSSTRFSAIVLVASFWTQIFLPSNLHLCHLKQLCPTRGPVSFSLLRMYNDLPLFDNLKVGIFDVMAFSACLSCIMH